MFAVARTAFLMLVVLTLLTGAAYPLLVTAVAQAAFPDKANGSMMERNGELIGSELIGQPFDDPGFFWGRPSATTPAYNAAASSGSNLGPTNPALLKSVADRVQTLRKAHPTQSGPVPVDLVTASASGLDPHISPAAAYYQVDRVADARGLPPERLRQLIDAQVEPRTLGLFGEPRVNVLRLNLALLDLIDSRERTTAGLRGSTDH